MQKLLALEQVSLVIRKGRLRWYGHVECKDDTDWTLDQMLYYTVSQKKGATLTMAITLSILDRFAKFFYYYKEQ